MFMMTSLANLLILSLFAFAFAAPNYELGDDLEIYEVILKDDSAMTLQEHVSWAQGVHIGASAVPEVDMFCGFMEETGERSYHFMTSVAAITIIRNHADVSHVGLFPI
jgi:hypothetical protein